MIDKLKGGRDMFSDCCCQTRFGRTQDRDLFTAEELRIVRAINEEFLRCFRRLPTVEERRCLEKELGMR